MKNLEEEISYFLKNGVGETLSLASAYALDIERRYSPTHAECKRARKIDEALVVIHENWKSVVSDYRDLSEHIMTPELHRASVCLRRERNHLKSRSERNAQDLYRAINRLLPVLSAFEGRERQRRQTTLFALGSRRKEEN